MTTKYGAAPELRGIFDLDFTEYMHYMYLPIWMADGNQWHVPERLQFAALLIEEAIDGELERDTAWDFIYVTARRGYATPGNPLNRPGWHSDGFGTPDVNYVWTDRYPTLFAEGEFWPIGDDHVGSITNMDENVAMNPDVTVRTYPDKMLMRLDSSVIHSAPQIPAPGGERSFFKVSFSNDRYDLIGNAHNYGLDYDWPMYPRGAVRNDPATAATDGKRA